MAMEVHLGGSYKFVMGLTGCMTLGIAVPLLYLATRSWPRTIDEEGMTLRNGKRVLWKDVKEIRPVTVVNQHGQRVTGRLELVFNDGTKSKIVPQSLAEGWSVLEYISKILKTDLATG